MFLWKLEASLLNRWLMAAITYHDALHGFWEGQSVGNAALEAKLLQQLTAVRDAVIFEVFLDLQKAYNNFDQ